MIRPDLATMLCFICTDAKIEAPVLQSMLIQAVKQSFNCITIDGDTSTNDTVLLLANGMSGVQMRTKTHRDLFQSVLDDLLRETARLLVKDGEGVTKVVEIVVEGAKSDDDAFRIVDTVAHSPLVKTAFFGEDANWGRLMMAIGRAGVDIDPDRVAISFDTIQMVKNGRGLGHEAETGVTAILKQPEFSVTIDLGLANGRVAMLTCDLSVDYVKINADYRS
jgi:glutamate N-acetyltransferase/amino-acid N-acetyltransferase